MDELLNNPNFRLIHVHDNGMSMVTPAKDASRDILKYEYRCISHCWGKDGKLWRDHRVDGVEHNVRIRNKNRRRSMQLFMKYKGYWWMDIFCVIQDDEGKGKSIDIGALNIMGDIYKNCKSCYCILDGSNNFSMKDLLAADDLFEGTFWKKDIFRDILDKCNLDDNMYDLLFYVFGSDWINRVWTLQECVLPNKTYFVAEYDNSPKISLEKIFKICDKLELHDVDTIKQDIMDCGIKGKVYHDGMKAIIILEQISLAAKEFHAIKEFRVLIQSNTQNLIKILSQLSYFRREATRDKDYVHGVSGLLGVEVGGETLEQAKEYMFAALWSKDIFMSNSADMDSMMYMQSPDGDCGELCRVYGKKFYNGIFVMKNNSTLRPNTISKHSLGNVVDCIDIGNGFQWNVQYKRTCKECQGYISDICKSCNKECRKIAGADIIHGTDNRQRRMSKMDLAKILSDERNNRIFWCTDNNTSCLNNKNIYLTDDYIVCLPYDYRYDIASDICIQLYGKPKNVWAWSPSPMRCEYLFADIVIIDKRMSMKSIGYIYKRR